MKKYVIEFLGTFFLALAAAFTANPLAVGFMFLAIVIIGQPISGAYFNPAVVVAGLVRGTISWLQGAWYIVAQSLGAATACTWFYLCYGEPYLPTLSCGAVGMNALLELLLTSLFILVILTAAATAIKPWVAPYIGAAAGLTLCAAGFSGGVCNPAIAGAAALISQTTGFTDGVGNTILVKCFSLWVVAFWRHSFSIILNTEKSTKA